jgi:SH3-like domain-containing protein
LLLIEAAAADWYRVRLPDGRQGYISYKLTDQLDPIRSVTLKDSIALLDSPDSLAASKKQLAGGIRLQQLAEFREFRFVRTEDNIVGWIKKDW